MAGIDKARLSPLAHKTIFAGEDSVKYFIGIDLGTSSVKLLLADGQGEIKRMVTRDYPVSYPHPGWSEQNAADWWQALCQALPELLAGFDGQQVQGIGVAGQMHGLVILDQADKPIRPVILWNDGRTHSQTAYLNQRVGKLALFSYTGNVAFAGFTAPKLMWLRENEPESFGRIHKIMLPKDYLNYLLTGVFCTDLSDASGTLLLDVKNRRWSQEMMELCGVTQAQLPRLLESYEPVGTLLPEFARRFGINEKAVVVAGAGDNAAAAVGTGTVDQGRCNISLGTSGTVFVSSNAFSGDPQLAVHSFCHADGGYHLMGCILSAASCNQWFCREVLHTEDYRAMEVAVAEDALGNNTVFFLPYLMGERSPINDTDATGLFVGLRPDTTREDMYLAVLEGVAFAIRDNLEIIKNFGVGVSASCLCGGGAKSRLWARILSNVLNIPLVLPVTEQGPGYGAALLAMVGAGHVESVSKAAQAFFRPKQTLAPDPQLALRYARRYESYKKIYPAVKELYKSIKE